MLKHSVNLEDLQELRSICCKLLNATSDDKSQNPAARARGSNMIFVKYIALRLQDVIHVPADDGEKRTHYEIFTSRGLWRTKLVADATTLIGDVLSELVKPLRSPYWCKAKVSLQEPLDSVSFLRSLIEPVMAAIHDNQPDLPELDGDVTRHKVLFADGMLLDCKSGIVRRALASDKMGHCAACPYVNWTPDCAAALNIGDKLFEFYKSGVKEFGDSELGLEIVVLLGQLAKKCRILEAVKAFADG